MRYRAALSIVGLVAMMGSAVGKDLETASASSVGMNAAALAQLKARMNALVADGDRAGVVYAIARKNKLVALEAIGKRNIERDLPMQPDTYFRIYSMTRPISGAATLTLVDENRLQLDDEVASYIPAFGKMKVLRRDRDNAIETEDQNTPMSVRHLFTYTSGLGYARDWPGGLEVEQSDILHPDVSLGDGLARLTQLPLLSQPGEKWRYGFSGDVLGRVAEVASGQPLDDFLKSRVFDRIGMGDTGFWISEEADADYRLAEVYGRASPDDALENVTSEVVALSHFTRPGKLFSGGGGLVSTVPDYLKFAQMLLNGGVFGGRRVLAESTVQLMLSRQTTPEQGEVYWYAPGLYASVSGWAWGLSIGVRPDDAGDDVPGRPGEVGWSGLANTFFMINLEEQIVAVVMAQYQGPDSNQLSAIFRDGVYAAVE